MKIQPPPWHWNAWVRLTVILTFFSLFCLASANSKSFDPLLEKRADYLRELIASGVDLSDLPQFQEGLPTEALVNELKEDTEPDPQHWSGIDRAALLAELEREETEAAERLILESASNSGVENGSLLLLLELRSSDDFRPYAKQLRTIARKVVSKRNGRHSYSRILLKARVFEECLRDEKTAKAIYRRLLSSEGRLSRIAHRKLERLEKKRNQRIAVAKRSSSLVIPDSELDSRVSESGGAPVIEPPVEVLLDEGEGN